MNHAAIFHTNLNYAFLIPENYERVIRSTHEVIRDYFPGNGDFPKIDNIPTP
jgi:hypothetical protein